MNHQRRLAAIEQRPGHLDEHALVDQLFDVRHRFTPFEIRILGGLLRAGDPQRQQSLLDEKAVRLITGYHVRIDPVRQHPLAEIVDSLKIDAVGDHRLAAGVHEFERQLCRFPVPPRPGLPLFVIEIRGPHRPLIPDPRPHRVQHVLGGSFGDPAVEPSPGFIGEGLHVVHPVAIIPQRDDRRGVAPIFEQPALVRVVDQPVEVGEVVAAQPTPDRDVLRACDHVQRVDLHAADLLDRLIDRGRRRVRGRAVGLVEPLGVQCKCAQRG